MRDVSILGCRLSKIEPLRALFLQELNAQCRYDAAHGRRGTAHYLIQRDDRAIGYGAVKDTHPSSRCGSSLASSPKNDSA
jgi:hypothetical protein